MIIPPLLYAETHYRFKYFFSFLRKAEPEILADIPHRLEPDADLPVMVIVKDSDRYPLRDLTIRIELRFDGKVVSTIDRQLDSKHQPLWWTIVVAGFGDASVDRYGFYEVDVHFSYFVGSTKRSCKNDNYRTSSKKSLRVYRSRYKLPSLDGWVVGDTHTHSSYTDDQVEFGAPLAPSIELSRAMGLSFFCVTDHSYDLDDRVDNYLVNDPSLPKWKALQTEVEVLNRRNRDFVVVRGEEVSCFNRARRNVHLLLWGTKDYFSGSGDSAERWFRTTAEHTIAEVLAQKRSGVVAYAAHPTESAPFFQWLLIRRGEWNLDDMAEPGLSGIQIMNGQSNDAFFRGLQCWSTLLLSGKRIYVSAGNDAHGNFNRFRQIGVPFFTIREHEEQLFGKMRTVVKTSSLTETSLLDSFRRGATAISNGPLLSAKIVNEQGASAGHGGELSGNRFQLHLCGSSSEEFGNFREVRIKIGVIGAMVEQDIVRDCSAANSPLEITVDIELSASPSPCYVRVEGYTARGHRGDVKGFCFTNPTWITPL